MNNKRMIIMNCSVQFTANIRYVSHGLSGSSIYIHAS